MHSSGIHFHPPSSSWKQLTVGPWPAIAAGLLVIAYFVYCTQHVFQTWLLWDDIFNLHYYWSRPLTDLIEGNLLFFSDYYRPLGGIYSLGVFLLFGLNATAYHVATLAILLLNLLILYGITRVLSGSREIAFFAALLGAYHYHLRDLYYQGGMVYDALAFLFVFLCLWCYVRVRSMNQLPGPLMIVGLLVLFIFALNAKEVSISLPLLVAAYELLWHLPSRWNPLKLLKWVVMEGRFALCSALVGAVYVYGKSTGPAALGLNPAFTPHISLETYLANYGTHISGLFFDLFPVDSTRAAAVLVGMLLTAAILRSRMLAFSASVAILAFLPVGFIESRNGYAIYVPFAGWVMYAATLAARLRDLLLPKVASLLTKSHWAERPWWRALEPLPILVGFAVLVVPQNTHNLRMFEKSLSTDEYGLHASYLQLSQIGRGLPPGARVLLVGDSAPPTVPAIYFLIRLIHDDTTLQVVRAKEYCSKGEPVPAAQYDLVLDYAKGQYIDLTPRWSAADLSRVCGQPDEYINQDGNVVVKSHK